MDSYVIWCDIRPEARDLDFVAALDAYLGHLQRNGLIAGYRVLRRKLGFGPPDLGDWFIEISTTDLAQLDQAFELAATRAGEVERLHAGVFSQVRRARFGLYRDFPDPQRTAGQQRGEGA